MGKGVECSPGSPRALRASRNCPQSSPQQKRWLQKQAYFMNKSLSSIPTVTTVEDTLDDPLTPKSKRITVSSPKAAYFTGSASQGLSLSSPDLGFHPDELERLSESTSSFEFSEGDFAFGSVNGRSDSGFPSWPRHQECPNPSLKVNVSASNATDRREMQDSFQQWWEEQKKERPVTRRTAAIGDSTSPVSQKGVATSGSSKKNVDAALQSCLARVDGAPRQQARRGSLNSCPMTEPHVSTKQQHQRRNSLDISPERQQPARRTKELSWAQQAPSLTRAVSSDGAESIISDVPTVEPEPPGRKERRKSLDHVLHPPSPTPRAKAVLDGSPRQPRRLVSEHKRVVALEHSGRQHRRNSIGAVPMHAPPSPKAAATIASHDSSTTRRRRVLREAGLGGSARQVRRSTLTHAIQSPESIKDSQSSQPRLGNRSSSGRQLRRNSLSSAPTTHQDSSEPIKSAPSRQLRRSSLSSVPTTSSSSSSMQPVRRRRIRRSPGAQTTSTAEPRVPSRSVPVAATTLRPTRTARPLRRWLRGSRSKSRERAAPKRTASSTAIDLGITKEQLAMLTQAGYGITKL